MARIPQEFARLLTKAVNQIHALEDKPKQEVKDELGIAAGRQGHHTIEYWCKGHIPDDAAVESLAREISKRNGLGHSDLRSFLLFADYLHVDELLAELEGNLRQEESLKGNHASESADPPPASSLHPPAPPPRLRKLRMRRPVLLAAAVLVPLLFATIVLVRQAVGPRKVETARGVSLVTGQAGTVRVASAQGRLTSGSIYNGWRKLDTKTA